MISTFVILIVYIHLERRNSHENVCKDHDFCEVLMLNDEN